MDTELNLSDSELVVMRVIWTLGETSAEQIGKELENFNWSPSTIKTFLARLTKKKILTTSRISHRYIYKPTLTEDEAIEIMTQEFLRKICARKHTSVIKNMVDSSQFTITDKQQLEQRMAKIKPVPEVVCDCVSNMQFCACD